MKKDDILKKIKAEVERMGEEEAKKFLEVLKQMNLKKAIEKSDCALTSEESLKKDWLNKEEDKAWEDL